MSIGWVMFWKAVVLGVGAAIIESYRAYKRRRARDGLPMRHDKRRDVYVVDGRLERAEILAKRVGLAALVPLGLYAALVLYIFLS